MGRLRRAVVTRCARSCLAWLFSFGEYAGVAFTSSADSRTARAGGGPVASSGQLLTRHHPWRRIAKRGHDPRIVEVERLISARASALVVFSDGAAVSPVELLELCTARRAPFVTICQAYSDSLWHPDEIATRYRVALPRARRCYFVSQANLRLLEKQIGVELPNAEVVWNPVNLPPGASPPWPRLGKDGQLRFACVARLDPIAKGQDILFEVLATQRWRDRRWQLYLYGEGRNRQVLEHLAKRLEISDRVVFSGFESVEKIWAANHVLVMPSRFEGMPLALVEAMLCGRPVIATDVAGHAEIIEDGVTGFLADAPTTRAVASALERFWVRRDEAEEMGKAGILKIRQMMPIDPVRVFSDKLLEVAGVIPTQHG